MTTEPLNTVWYDAATDEEFEGINFPALVVAPSVGDEIHYWQDGIGSEAGSDSGPRIDLRVERIRHDLRYLPARGGSAIYVHTIEVWVKLL